MTPLHSLVTALIRLLALYFVVSSLDSLATPFFGLIVQVSMMPDDPEFRFPNPWYLFLPGVAFYVAIGIAIFFGAPRLARLMIGAEGDTEAEIPWHQTLLFCTGVLIVAWAFVRITDAVYDLIFSAANNEGEYVLDNAMMSYLFMSAFLLGAGILLIAKFHRISAWISERRTFGEQRGTEQAAATGESKAEH